MTSVVNSLIKYVSILSTVWIFSGCALNSTSNLVSISGQTMGTTYSVKIVDSLSLHKSTEIIKTGIDSVLAEVNQQMSTYIPSSEISQFNKSVSTDWQNVSQDFANVLNATKIIGIETEGASDLTVGPLVNIWGFGPNYIPEMIPTEEEILEAKSKIGLNKIHVRVDPPSLKKDISSIYCDLSSTAKGFGVDKVAEFVERLGFSNYLVEIGGEVKVKGKNHQSSLWKVGISTPDASGKLQRAIELENLALATSGDYWNYYEKDGERFSHLIDPRTGKPITHKLASVTVIHNSCMIADGFATAINVMGVEEGLKFANDKNLSVYMIVRSDTGFETIESSKFTETYTLNQD